MLKPERKGVIPMNQSRRSYHDDQQAERQRKAIRSLLFQMIDTLDERSGNIRRYQPFPIGVLEKTIEKSLQGLEDLVRSLVSAIEKRIPKPWNK